MMTLAALTNNISAQLNALKGLRRGSPVYRNAVILPVLLHDDLPHLVPHIDGPILGGDHVWPLLPLPRRGVEHLEGRRMTLFGIPEPNVYREACANVFVTREKWHKGESLEYAALPTALLADYDELGRLPSLEGGGKDIPERVERLEDVAQLVDARHALEHVPEVDATRGVLHGPQPLRDCLEYLFVRAQGVVDDATRPGARQGESALPARVEPCRDACAVIRPVVPGNDGIHKNLRQTKAANFQSCSRLIEAVFGVLGFGFWVLGLG